MNMDKQKIAKIKRLAEQGKTQGERQAAQHLLEKLKKKYKNDFSKISTETKDSNLKIFWRAFKKAPFHKKIELFIKALPLLCQIFFVIGKIVLSRLHIVLGLIFLGVPLLIILFLVAQVHKFCRWVDMKIIDWRGERAQRLCKHEFVEEATWLFCKKCNKEIRVI